MKCEVCGGERNYESIAGAYSLHGPNDCISYLKTQLATLTAAKERAQADLLADRQAHAEQFAAGLQTILAAGAVERQLREALEQAERELAGVKRSREDAESRARYFAREIDNLRDTLHNVQAQLSQAQADLLAAQQQLQKHHDQERRLLVFGEWLIMAGNNERQLREALEGLLLWADSRYSEDRLSGVNLSEIRRLVRAALALTP